MNRFQRRIEKIKEEMRKGQGGQLGLPIPFPLEPAYKPFDSSIKPPSFLERLCEDGPNDRYDPRSQTTPLSFIRVRPSPDDEGDGQTAASFLMTLHLHFPAAFEIIGSRDQIAIQIVVQPGDVATIIGNISAHYPHTEVFETKEDALGNSIRSRLLHLQCFRLEQSYFFPLNTDWKMGDPYVSLFGTLSGLASDEVGMLQTLFIPTLHDWRSNILRAARSEFDPKQTPFSDLPDLPKLAEQKTKTPLFACSVRMIGSSPDIIQRLERFFNRFKGENRFIRGPQNYPLQSAIDRTNHAIGIILNADELSLLIHLPRPDAILPVVEKAKRTAPAPSSAKDPQGIIFGRNTHRGKFTPVAIGKDWLTRHLLCLGATGSGKSVWQAGFFQQFIQHHGAIYIDPSGDSARAFLKLIPPERADSVIYLDPTDPGYTPAFNVLELGSFQDVDLVRGSLITAFKRLFGSDGLGPRSEWLLSHALGTVLKSHHRPKTLLDLPRLFSDSGFLSSALTSISDPQIHQFWKTEYPKLPQSAILPLLNKLHSFLGHEKIRAMLVQPAKFKLDSVMRDKQILIFNLPKGVLGEAIASTLGFLILAAIQQTVLGLSRIPSEKRNHFTIILDEAHLFLGKENAETINSLLSESRKFKCVTVLGTQFLAQADRMVRDALLGNVGTLLCFRVGIDDAQLLQKEFGPFTANDLLNLLPGEALIRVGRARDSFNLETPFIDLERLPEGSRPLIIQQSRERYYTRRDQLSLRLSNIPAKDLPKGQPIKTNDPIPALSEPEKRFLDCVYRHPTLSVTKLYREQGLTAYMGDKFKTQLKQKEYVREVETHLGERSRFKFLLLTQKGFGALEVRFGSQDGKGGGLHRHFQSIIRFHAEAAGYRVRLEESIPGTKETVDVGLEKHGRRIAIEVSVTCRADQELKNIQKNLSAGYHRVLMFVLDEPKKIELQALVDQKIADSDRSRVMVSLIYHFVEFL